MLQTMLFIFLLLSFFFVGLLLMVFIVSSYRWPVYSYRYSRFYIFTVQIEVGLLSTYSTYIGNSNRTVDVKMGIRIL